MMIYLEKKKVNALLYKIVEYIQIAGNNNIKNSNEFLLYEQQTTKIICYYLM